MKNPKQKPHIKEHNESENNLEMKKMQQKLMNQVSGLKKIQKASTQKK